MGGTPSRQREESRLLFSLGTLKNPDFSDVERCSRLHNLVAVWTVLRLAGSLELSRRAPVRDRASISQVGRCWIPYSTVKHAQRTANYHAVKWNEPPSLLNTSSLSFIEFIIYRAKRLPCLSITKLVKGLDQVHEPYHIFSLGSTQYFSIEKTSDTRVRWSSEPSDAAFRCKNGRMCLLWFALPKK